MLLFLWATAFAADFSDPDAARMEADLQQLVQGGFASRHIHHPDHQAAGDWLLSRLESIDGLNVSVETFSAAGRDDLRNLVADLPGTDPGLPWLVLGAHWDSTASADADFDSATDPAPGADDDASGVVAVLEIARQMATEDWQHSVRFVLFDAEEQGLLGSAFHASGMADEAIDVAQMWSLDPIGYNAGGANNLWVTYDARWPDAAEKMAATELDDLLVTAIDRDVIGGGDRSDHASFWDEKVPAVHVASWPQPPTYHMSGDTLDNVDLVFLRNVAGLVLVQVSEAAVPAPPLDEKTGCGCRSTSGVMGQWWVLWVLLFGRIRR